MLVLTNDDVRQIITASVARDIVREGAVAYSTGTATIPSRIHLQLPELAAASLFMPGFEAGRRALGLKVVGEFAGNPAKGLPVVVGTLLMLDPETGLPAVLADAGHLTDVRTAAMTAVAAEHLARPDSHALTVIGTGRQAAAHIHALVDVFPITGIRVVSRELQRAKALCDRVAEDYPQVEFTPSGPDGATTDGCDLVVTTTRSMTPVLPDAPARPGTLVCGVGSHRPDAAEIPPALVRSAARVVVDTRAGSIDSAGDIAPVIRAGHLAREDVAELGDLITGRRGGRASDEEVTVFKSAGFAALDLVAGAMLMEQAKHRGLGRQVEI